MDKLLNVSSSPHVRDKSSTKSIMRDVVIALIPTTLVGIGNFGVRALLVILTTCASALLAEYVWQKCMKQPITTNDFSALLTGLLLALNLPATLPLWMCVLGGVFAIYELLPAFIIGLVFIVAVSLVTKEPDGEILEEFEKARK